MLNQVLSKQIANSQLVVHAKWTKINKKKYITEGSFVNSPLTILFSTSKSWNLESTSDGA
jgi:hypothetical protein